MNETTPVTRREVLKWAATGVALAGAAYVEQGCRKSPGAKTESPPSPAPPPPSGPSPTPASQALTGWFDVTTFGAKGDGVTPDEGAINQALEAAYNAKGGVVWFPPGLYLIESKIIIQYPVTLLGAGWDGGGHPYAGSWIMTKTPGVNVEIHGRGTSVQAIGFSQAQPIPHKDDADWKPLDYDFAILVTASDVFLKQIHLLPCTKGIKIQSAGRVILDHIFGQPLTTGIEIDNARDVVKVNNVHFWGFWSGEHPVRAWMRSNGTGLNCLRADNPQFSNLFFLGYHRGIAFGASKSGITSKFKIVNADCDSCETGLEVGGENATGDVTNFSCQGSPGEVGISVISPGVQLFLSHARVTSYRGNALLAKGNNIRVFGSNLWAQNWNTDKNGAPAVEATDGATIYLGRPLFFEHGNGAANWQRDGANGGHVLTGYDELICTV